MAKAKAAPAVDFSEGDSLMVDLNEVADVSFEALPRAMYPVIVAECEFSHSQSKGTAMWTLTLEVSDGEFAGRKLFSHMVWEGPGLPITKRQITRIRPDLLEGPFDPQDEDVIASMLGLDLRAKVTVRKYQGEDRNNVQDLFPGGDDDSFV